MTCQRCGSQAINHHLHGRDGSDPDLCDVCYWRKRAEMYAWELNRLRDVVCDDDILSIDRVLSNKEDGE